MRITDGIVYSNVKNQVNKNKSKLDELNTQLSSGQILQKLGDDPVLFASSMRNDRRQSEMTQLGKSQQLLIDRYNLYETKSQEVYDTLSKFKADLVRLSTATENTTDVRAELLAQVKSVREQLLNVANTKDQGQAIFSGALTDQDAYSSDGVYHGDTTAMQVDVMPDTRMPANITGDTVFSFAGSDGLPTNIFNVLNQLETALSTGDPRSAASDQIGNAGKAIDQVSYSQIQIGVNLNRLTLAKSSLSALQTNLTTSRTESEGVDYVSAYTDYQATSVALNASLQTSSTLIQKSLMDYLR